VTRAPLDGLRVLALSQFGAGPFGTAVLADLGAEVIKIEDPGVGGDVSRYVPPYQADGDSLYFQSFNRGKKSLALDLRHPTGRACSTTSCASPTPSTTTSAATCRRRWGSPTPRCAR
jgi:crotonobetainyl-CoA:carnitine CoA-transferase CaiB-like acyl-CoA transferase